MVKGYLQTFHLKHDYALETGTGTLKAESCYSANPAATGATRGCQWTLSMDNLWRQWRQRRLTGELPAFNEESILR